MPKPEKTNFDELILSKTRLGIISALIGGDKLEFTFLRNILGMSDGNLSVQIRKLWMQAISKWKRYSLTVSQKLSAKSQIKAKMR